MVGWLIENLNHSCMICGTSIRSYLGSRSASLDSFLAFLESICDLLLYLLDPLKVFLESVHYYSSLLLIISQSLL